METKDQLNQNPENVEIQHQEENSKSVETTDENVEEKSDKSEKEMEKSKKNEKVEKKASKKPATSKTKKTVKKTKEKAVLDDKAPEDGKKKAKAEKAKIEEVKAGEKTIVEEKVVETTDEQTETADKQEELVKEPGKKIEKAVVEDKDEGQDTNSDNEDDDLDEEHEDVEEDYDGKTREELVAILEETVVDEDVIKIKKKIALIKVAYHKINKEEQNKKLDVVAEVDGDGEGAAEESEKVVDEVEKHYNTAFAIYRTNRKKFLEEQEKLKQQNLEAKKVILEELKTLIDSEESLKKTYDEFKTLQEKWREIGMVPKSEVNNLWQNYHFFVEKFFDKVKMNKELRDLDMKKNLEAKIDLCEKAEELLLETCILKSFKELQTLHHKWKEVGPVPQDKNDEIWERFKATTEKINERRREHYNQLQDDQKNNLLAKNALCEKAEEILNLEQNTIKEWQTVTDKISELLKVWKSIGRAP